MSFGPRIIPIPLRADVTVQIAHLPDDLTPTEAAKIGRVILALSAETASPARANLHRLDEPENHLPKGEE